MRADPDGRFAFENISNDPRTAYLLGVRYGEIPFSLRTTFATGESELTTDIVVARTRTDATGVERGASELRLDRGCSGVRVTEGHSFSNPTDFVFFVPPDERDDRPPIARLPLPSGAVYFEAVGSPLEEGVELRDGEVLATLRPRQDFFAEHGQRVTAPDAYATMGGDVYVILIGWEDIGMGGSTFKVYYNPLITWTWFGAFVLIGGTLVAMWPQRAGRTQRTYVLNPVSPGPKLDTGGAAS